MNLKDFLKKIKLPNYISFYSANYKLPFKKKNIKIKL